MNPIKERVKVELDELTRKTMSLEIENQALKKEKDEISKNRISELDEKLVDDLKNSCDLKVTIKV